MNIKLVVIAVLGLIWFITGNFWIVVPIFLFFLGVIGNAFIEYKEAEKNRKRRDNQETEAASRRDAEIKADESRRLEEEQEEEQINKRDRDLVESLESEWQSVFAQAKKVAKDHAAVLLRKRKSGVFDDEYGNEDRSQWDREYKKFYNEVVLRQVGIDKLLSIDRELSVYVSAEFGRRDIDLFGSLDSYIAFGLSIDVGENMFASSNEIEDVNFASGVEFEEICAESLRGYGWKIQKTPKTGDQGVDVVVRVDGISVAIQCKRHSRPVGNSSIQEVVAGRVHYGADYAAVISSSAYTKSAMELAASNDVILLRYEEISSLKNRIIVTKKKATVTVGKKAQNTSPDKESFIKKQLIAKRDEIIREAGNESKKDVKVEARQIIESALDDGDLSVIDLSHKHDIALKRLGAHRENLIKIDEALRKIQQYGTYGVCDECGEQLSAGRLKVMPSAIFCRDCQEKKEELEKAGREEELGLKTGI